jgi:putative spermidine/putrescine transport system ATP-binding protein
LRVDGEIVRDQPAATGSRPAAGGAAVLLDRVSRHFGAVAAVLDLSLAIERGEFVTFLGPSGSGKTTTLMIIAGFESADHGEILIDNESILRLPPYRRNIGVVFQNYALFPHLTVAENIGFALRQRGESRASIQSRVGAMLETVQLPGLGGRYPRQLSGGQQQRVAIARALVFAPRLLLMDEPLSALDKKLREELQLEIKRLHEKLGITFIHVTHDQREALVMSDRIAVMHEGRLQQFATPGEIYDRPANRFVASFVGEGNFLEGPITPDGAARMALRLGKAVLVAPTRSLAEPSALMVRPEKLSLHAAPAAGLPSRNSLAGKVVELAFIGEMHRYVVATECGQTLIAKETHREDVPVRAPGEAVTVSWAIEDTLLV